MNVFLLKIILPALFVFASSESFAQCPGSPPTGIDCVASGANKDITGSSCAKITNSHASGKALMVPTGATEWAAFLAHLPSGVTSGACSGGATQSWIKTLGGGLTDKVNSVAVDSSGNVYVTGQYTNTSANASAVTDFAGANLNGKTATSSLDVFVAKFNSSGAQQWIKTLGGTSTDNGASVAVDSSGNVYVAGNYTNTTTNANSVTDFAGAALNGKTATASTDGFIAKLNSSGTQQWIKTIGGTGSDGVLGVAVDASLNVYVNGAYVNTSANASSVKDFSAANLNGLTTTSSADAFVAKLDSSGTQQWIKTFGGKGTDNSIGIALDSSANVYVTGNYTAVTGASYAVVDFSGASVLGYAMIASNDIYVAKLNTSGTQQWIKTMGGADSDVTAAIAVDSSSNVYVSGSADNSTGAVTDFSGSSGPTGFASADVFVAKLNSSGTQQWIKEMGGSSSDSAKGVSVDSSGNVFVAGYYSNDSSNSDAAVDFAGAALAGRSGLSSSLAFVAKLNSSGTQQWVSILGGTFGDQANSVAADSSGGIISAGNYANTTTNGNSDSDFANATLNGKSATTSTDAFVAKLQ